MSGAAAELASTLQSASINPHPSPEHDVNPSTSASRKEPVTLAASSSIDSDIDEDEIPLSVLHPRPRRHTLPPLPDLRFEQSYLKSIEKAEGWQGVLYITVRDQVILPLLQGTLWTLLLAGWRHWNRSTQFQGRSLGARLRRWWWSVNKWAIPHPNQSASASASTTNSAFSFRSRRLASNVQEFYEDEFGAAGWD